MISPEDRLKEFQAENNIFTKGPLSLVVQFTRLVQDKRFPLSFFHIKMPDIHFPQFTPSYYHSPLSYASDECRCALCPGGLPQPSMPDSSRRLPAEKRPPREVWPRLQAGPGSCCKNLPWSFHCENTAPSKAHSTPSAERTTAATRTKETMVLC